ncbi:uncharacterized protein VTP21DRAFT_6622 [Calcarisporiella thermophila]|uniref:uncharacterized protein n=1 Tax=Calcarisporiella thermophila TaxID=911321 RepID=UPI00374443B7
MSTLDLLPHSKHVDWSDRETAHRLHLAAASLFFDVGVLLYHFTTPYHPKFYVKPARRIALRVHIVSGCLEILSCVAAFYAKDPTPYAYAAAICAAIGHVPSTFYKVPTVLGIKAFLVPSLFMVSALHGYFALKLALNPTSFYYLMSTFLTVHIYAWSRVFFALYYRFKLFESHRFSASMLTSGMLMIPAVLGYRGNLILLGGVLLSDILIKTIKKNPHFWKEWTTENPRELAASPERKVVLDALVTAAEVSTDISTLASHDPVKRYATIVGTVMSANKRKSTPSEKAKSVFRAIDINNDGRLSIEEFKHFLRACGISEVDIDKKLMIEEVFGDKESIDFDEFATWFTRHWVHQSSITIPHLPKTSRGEAKMVFDALDCDGSGYLDIEELQYLLQTWGLPEKEAHAYLKSVDKNNDGQICFDEFYRNMKTIWKFGAQSFIDEGKVVVEAK